MRLFSLKTGRAVGPGYHAFCPDGGIVEVEYDLDRVRLLDSPNPYVRFSALLPVREAADRLPAGVRPTPLVHARGLGGRLGMRSLWLKDETVLPTRSTKDRMAAVALAYLHDCGVRDFCMSSTGNSSTAYAYAIPAYPQMRVRIFTGEDFIHRVHHASHPQVIHYGLRQGTFVDAASAAATHARDVGITSEQGFFNVGRREGLKLAFFEACEQCPRPIDWYVQAVSSAMGVAGTFKGAKELRGIGMIDRLPRLLCVQQESCAPMVEAHREGSDAILPHHVVSQPRGIAQAILRGNPRQAYPHVRGIVQESGGDFESASEAEIREARTMLWEFEGIDVCFSAAAALAGLVKRIRRGAFPVGDTVMVNLTGGDRPGAADAGHVRWLVRESGSWRPDCEQSGRLQRRAWGPP